jgi:hypothetical protein
MLRERAAQGPGWHEPGQPAGLPAHWAAGAIPPPPQADPREAFVAAGLAWVTPHVLRETVAILMDHASLSSRAAAGQLGHANASMTTDIDFGPEALDDRAGARDARDVDLPHQQEAPERSPHCGSFGGRRVTMQTAAMITQRRSAALNP